MNDIKIDLSEVNPQEFFGDQNANIAKLRTYFPKIKIVARGNTLKAYGEDSILSEFSKRVDMLIAHFGKFNILNDEIIERIVLAGTEDHPACVNFGRSLRRAMASSTCAIMRSRLTRA